MIHGLVCLSIPPPRSSALISPPKPIRRRHSFNCVDEEKLRNLRVLQRSRSYNQLSVGSAPYHFKLNGNRVDYFRRNQFQSNCWRHNQLTTPVSARTIVRLLPSSIDHLWRMTILCVVG